MGRDAFEVLRRQKQLSGGGVQGRKELIGRVRLGLDQGVEERGFTRIGVAHQGDTEVVRAQPSFSLGQALFFNAFEFFFGAFDRLRDHAPIEFDLCLPWATTVANATALALQVRPSPHEPGAQVLQPCELDLQFALVRACALGKDLQNQHGAVIHRQAHVSLQIALLRRTQSLVKQDLLCADALGKGFDFIGLARTHKQGGIGRFSAAHKTLDDLKAGGLCKEAQLPELGIEIPSPQVHADQ